MSSTQFVELIILIYKFLQYEQILHLGLGTSKCPFFGWLYICTNAKVVKVLT